MNEPQIKSHFINRCCYTVFYLIDTLMFCFFQIFPQSWLVWQGQRLRLSRFPDPTEYITVRDQRMKTTTTLWVTTCFHFTHITCNNNNNSKCSERILAFFKRSISSQSVWNPPVVPFRLITQSSCTLWDLTESLRNILDRTKEV